jgi:serine/threonine protein kinase
MIGSTISHYKIIEKLGEGGMGVVYKAQDTKLDRILALKFLPPHLTVNESDKARFLQEAKAASAINHPNVCVVHDIQEHDDRQFIVMEYVEGTTLRAAVGATGSVALEINQVIDYAIQIAAALDAAHEKGIIHRDIKSDNIMLTTKKQIKVMDFGLAKLKGSLKLTKTSSTVGTLAYMGPEQIEGKVTDARSDIFSFGVVLYEMLTGKLPFDGEYESALMYNILNEDPEPLENIRSDISSELDHIVNRSLEKDPDDRYQNMNDVLIELKRVKRDSSKVSRKSSKEMPVVEERGERREEGVGKKSVKKPVWVVPAIGVFVIVVLLIVFMITRQIDDEPNQQFKSVPFTSLPGEERWPTFSPDGSQIAYSWSGENVDNWDIYVELIGAGTRQAMVSDAADDICPAWSPDGRYLAFYRSTGDDIGIWIVPVRGGTAKKLKSIVLEENLFNLSWSPDSKHIAFSAYDSLKRFTNIFYLNIDSRQINNLTHDSNQNRFDTYCAVSPDGEQLAFTRGLPGDEQIFNVPVAGGIPEQITSNNDLLIWGLTWSNDGHEIIYSAGIGNFVGHEVFPGDHSLWRISAAGGEPKQIPLTGTSIVWPTISQKNQLAYEKWSGDVDIWQVNISGSENKNNIPSKLIYSTQSEFEAEFSPDGKYIAYVSTRSGSAEVYVCDRDGKNQIQLTSFGNAEPGGPNWSPDGKSIVFDSGHIDNQPDIYSISYDGGTAQRVTNDPGPQFSPRFSSDGKWIYFRSIKNGEDQIWKIPSQGGDAIQVTKHGGHIAVESVDGQWLYYTKYGISGIWRMPAQGGEETLILDYPVGVTNWAVVKDGIYYRHPTEDEGYIIEFYSFTTKRSRKVFGSGERFPSSLLSIAQNEQWILYDQSKYEVDIHLIENFR